MTALKTSFTGRDYTATLEWLVALARQEVPSITDYNHSGVWMGLLRMFARNTDLLNLYIDAAFSEGNITTARFMQSLIDLGTLLDIKPVMVSPASTTLRITRLQGEEGAISIPKGSAFARLDGVQYTILEATSLPIGTEYVDVTAYQGTLSSNTVLLADWEQLDASGRMRINLSTGIVDWSVSMVDSLANEWERVDSFYRSQATDTHFTLDYHADKIDGVAGCYLLTLGDGIYGVATPPINATVEYLQTDGSTGNCGTGVITVVVDNIPVTVTNTTEANGGADAETIERFRWRIPPVARSQRRGLVKEDYEALISSIQGVASVQVVDKSNGPEWPYLYAFIYVHPAGGGQMQSGLHDAVEAQCTSWGHLGNWAGRYIIQSATETDVDVTLLAGVQSGHSQNTVTANINAALSALLEPGTTTVGDGLTLAEISAALSNVTGLEWFTIQTPTASIVGVDGNVLVLGTVSVTYG